MSQKSSVMQLPQFVPKALTSDKRTIDLDRERGTSCIGSRGTGTWNGARHLRAGILMRMASVHALLSDIVFLNFSSARETCVVSQDHRSMSMRTPQ